jgi:hypothetical protein
LMPLSSARRLVVHKTVDLSLPSIYKSNYQQPQIGCIQLLLGPLRNTDT